jgi:uroporphyrinogen-III synthase
MHGSAKLARELRQASTQPEQRAWHLLRNRRLLGVKFRRQRALGKYVVDFYCFQLRLAIELDGSVHSQPSQKRKDDAKDAYLRRLGVHVLRLPNGLILEAPEDFLKKVREALPSPVRQGGHPLPKERA